MKWKIMKNYYNKQLNDLLLEKENINRMIVHARYWLANNNTNHPKWNEMNESKFKLIEDLGRVIIDINQMERRGFSELAI